jgi:hypothetical protein
MTIKMFLAAVGAVALLSTGVATAQTPPPASKPAATEKAPATAKPKRERSAKSIECSKQADAKGLHGKARKKFRSECKKS